VHVVQRATDGHCFLDSNITFYHVVEILGMTLMSGLQCNGPVTQAQDAMHDTPEPELLQFQCTFCRRQCMSALPASMGVHGVFEVLVLVVVDPLLALSLLGLYPVGSCTHTHPSGTIQPATVTAVEDL